MNFVGIKGIGHYVPDTIVANNYFEKILDTSDEWIKTMTGIKERRFINKEEATSDLCYKASLKAIENAKINKDEIDAIIVATVTPDYKFPMTACLLQKKLELNNIPCFDLNAACSGFIYGMTVAESLIKSELYKNILFVGAEALSTIINMKDRNSVILFGDGAAAIILSKVEDNYGILSRVLGAEGDDKLNLFVKSGGSKHKIDETSINNGDMFLNMNGKEVFKFATRIMPKVTLSALEQINFSVEDIDFLFPHQANIRIIEAASKRLNIPMDKIFVNLEKYGNTSAASVGIALSEAVQNKVLKKDDIVVLTGFGAGLTYGSIVMRWLY